MPKPISRRELIRKLRSIGFLGPYSGGRHEYLERDGFKLFVPNPHGKDIGPVLLSRIILELKISRKKFIEM